MSTVDGWRKIRHSGVVSVREAFTTKSFGDHSLVFVYDYHPLATTIYNKFFSVHSQNMGLPEKTLWSFIIQIASSLKAIHDSGLAVRTLEPTKILITGKNRIRLNCCGIFDMLTYDGNSNPAILQQFQHDDLLHFGQLVMALACGSLVALHNISKSIDFISRHYSLDLKNIMIYLLSKPHMHKSINDVITMIGPRILHEINSANQYVEVLDSFANRTHRVAATQTF
ncbi:PAB-dependent poly(A)-specific ribonuclease subunit 3 [Irineochytrium annulatum]|nr:PAB-dependent poly(A)-specific ribonuclease subunit 3 [Irineochytrium annulatum]